MELQKELSKTLYRNTKPTETPPEKVDFSKYQLGNVEYSEEDYNYLISKSIKKKVKKIHKTQITFL